MRIYALYAYINDEEIMRIYIEKLDEKGDSYVLESLMGFRKFQMLCYIVV